MSRGKLSWVGAMVLLGMAGCARPTGTAQSHMPDASAEFHVVDGVVDSPRDGPSGDANPPIEAFVAGCGGASGAMLRGDHVEIWDLGSGARLETLAASAVVAGKHGYLAYTVDRAPIVWWSCELRESRTLGPSAGAPSAAPAIGGDVALVPISGGRSVEVWDLTRNVRVGTIAHPSGGFHPLAASDDGRYMVSGYDPWIWETSSGRVVATKDMDHVDRPRWEPGGSRLLLTRDSPGPSEIFDPITGSSLLLPGSFRVTGYQEGRPFPQDLRVVIWLWVPGARDVAALGSRRVDLGFPLEALVVDARTGARATFAPRYLLPLLEAAFAPEVTFSPDGTRALVADHADRFGMRGYPYPSKELALVEVPSGKAITRINPAGEHPVESVLWLSRSAAVALRYGRTIETRDSSDGRLLSRFDDAIAGALPLAGFAALSDGRVLTVSRDGVCGLWDVLHAVATPVAPGWCSPARSP